MARSHNKQASLSKLIVPSALALCICACLRTAAIAADDIQFNTDVLDVKDKQNIDLSRFSKRGYIMPGDYGFKIKVNQNELEEQTVSVFAAENDKNQSLVCFTPDQIKKFGFKEKYLGQFKVWHNGQCVDITALKGVEVTPDLGNSMLMISVPQAYLEYTSDNWVPPSMWDNGIPGVIADYNVNAQTRHNEGREGGDDNSVSGNGTFGANMGPWRLRADWQTNYDDRSGSSGQKKWTWSRFQMYRALPKMGAKLTVGEDYMNSDMFDSVRYTGASVVSDDNMLPPNLRGYAPEVTGVAKTNAKVTISQQGRVIYETQVAAGPFAIQDLNNSVSGALDVRVQEQDGSVQEYKVNTASIPYLTRPGSLRYKMYAGRPSTYDHHSEGSGFGSGEFSWGISNGWSLYGGLVASRNYLATALGVGRDLMALGALAFDITRSGAKLDNGEDRHGQSYRLSYSKRFDDTGSQVTFAGYRFSEKDFMSSNDYLNYRADNGSFMQSKEMYTISFNQQFESIGLSAYLNYSHQTYWSNPAEDRYSLSLSRYFDIGKMKNISASLTAYRNKFNGENDDGMYVSVSMPMGDTGTLGFNSSYDADNNSHSLSYFNRLDNGDNYRIAAGGSNDGGNLSGYYDHPGDLAEVSGNVDYQHGQYSSAGLSLRGGMTATAKGAALHRTNVIGGTRVLLDTGDAADIPVQGYANATTTNHFGKAVITDVSDYSKNSLSIDINHLPEDAEASASVVQATLTEGAIGYRKFNVISGLKAMAIIRLADGTYPPFGASVLNAENQEIGIVNDEGQAYLSGLQPGHQLRVSWNGNVQCAVTLPKNLQGTSQNENLLLPCR
ncbi:outer membrane usher protein [Cronobacter sakazakii]|uniref:outer membrane usher protein n=1 Tax=Cronobacter sakazakii TaxID=28141 RepID=UPI001319EE63|nr:outer membrane usher protein [Cronobacter sakazakii]